MAKSDFLKYYRVIKKFFMVKHKLSDTKIDILLFLYSEKYWDLEKYEEYNSLLSWDYARMANLLRDDWIRVFRKGVKFKSKTIYCMSPKAINMIESLYKKIEGEEIPETATENRMFHKKVPYSHNRYKKMITTMNSLNRKARLEKLTNLDGVFD